MVGSDDGQDIKDEKRAGVNKNARRPTEICRNILEMKKHWLVVKIYKRKTSRNWQKFIEGHQKLAEIHWKHSTGHNENKSTFDNCEVT